MNMRIKTQNGEEAIDEIEKYSVAIFKIIPKTTACTTNSRILKRFSTSPLSFP